MCVIYCVLVWISNQQSTWCQHKSQKIGTYVDGCLEGLLNLRRFDHSYLIPSLKLTAKAPENGWLEYDRFLLEPGLFKNLLLVSGSVYLFKKYQSISLTPRFCTTGHYVVVNIYTSILYVSFQTMFFFRILQIRFTDFLHTNLLEKPMMKQLRVSRFRHMLQWRRSLEHVPDEFLLCFVVSESWYLVRMLSRWCFQIFSMFIPIWGNDPFWLIFLKPPTSVDFFPFGWEEHKRTGKWLQTVHLMWYTWQRHWGVGKGASPMANG